MSSSRPRRRLSSSSLSAAVKYNTNPKWRSPYIKDARAKTTLTLVFAEPEEPKPISPSTVEKQIASMHDALNSECALVMCTVPAHFLTSQQNFQQIQCRNKSYQKRAVHGLVPFRGSVNGGMHPSLRRRHYLIEEPPNILPEVELTVPPQPTSTTMNDSPNRDHLPQNDTPWSRPSR
jgi:hypothetical protein